ncbi:MAG: hypothetical protein ACRDHF_09500 [Tepidiformaceae bacterium]
MYSKPTIDDFLDAVSACLNNDIMPVLHDEKAQVSVAMMQQILQCAKQIAHVEQQLMAVEHNEMAATFRDVGAIVGESSGPAADRIRARARALGGRPDMPAIPEWATLSGAHQQLSEGVVQTLDDLDALITAGNPAGSEALLRLRAHLGARTAREFGTYLVGEGMVGRG